MRTFSPLSIVDSPWQFRYHLSTRDHGPSTYITFHMKKNRVIFYILFALFHLGAFIFTVALGNDSGFLMSMFSWVPYFKWVTLVGVLLVLIDFVWTSIEVKNRNREKAALQHEVNTLKAKLFDMQEEVTRKASERPPLNPPSPTPPAQP